MFKKHILWIVTIMLFHCSQQISSEDDSDKTKREVWSSGNFNSFSDDKNDKSFGPMSPFAQVFSAIDSLGLKMKGNVKSTVEFWPPDMDKEKFYKLRQEESAFPLTSWFNFKPLVKETKEPEISYPIVVNNDDNKKNSHDLAESTVKQLNKDNYSTKSLKDYTTKPDVIRNSQKYFKHERYTVKPEIHDIQYDQKYILSTAKPEVIDNIKYDVKYYKSTIKRPEVVHELGYEQNNFKSIEKPFIGSVEYENAVTSPAPLNDHSITTEQTINFDDAMTNVGPVVFPVSIGLTEEKRTHEFITFVPTTAASPRANKKRKLKKKVKTSSITQLNMEKYITQAPPTVLVMNSSIDVIAETSSDYTPVYGFIDHDSIHYTDIISNLSNLTEMSFNSFNGTGNNHHQFKQQSDHQKSIKNNIYSSKKIIHSTTPYSFIIKVEPEKVAETQDDVIKDVKIKNQVTLSSKTSLPPHDMKKLESPKLDSSKKAAEKKILKQKVTDDMSSNFKIIVENNSSPTMSTISNSIDERYFTTTVSTVKNLQRSRFGIRNFKPRAKSEAVRNQASSTASSVASSSSTTVKSIPKRIKSSINTVSVSTSSEKPINDSMMIVKSTARYYTPKSRTRHHQNSRIKQSTTKSSSTLATKLTTVKTKIRRTTKKSSKN